MRRESFIVLSAILSINAAFAQNSSTGTSAHGVNSYPRLGLIVDTNLIVTRLLPGSPAEKARLLIGDKIVAIEGRQVDKLTVRERIQLLAGKPGTISHLSILRGSSRYAVVMTRVDSTAQTTAGRATETVPPKIVTPPSALDKSFVTVQRPNKHTDDMFALVMQGLALMPVDVKRDLINRGVSIVITPSRQVFNGTRGGCAFSIKTETVIVPEWNDQTNDSINLKRIPITTLHELGHAYDFTQGKISSQPEFRQLYEEESARVPPDKRKLLAYFLDEESGKGASNSPDFPPHSPPQECFATLFAKKYFKGDDRMLDTLKACFPKCFTFVQNQRP